MKKLLKQLPENATVLVKLPNIETIYEIKALDLLFKNSKKEYTGSINVDSSNFSTLSFNTLIDTEELNISGEWFAPGLYKIQFSKVIPQNSIITVTTNFQKSSTTVFCKWSLDVNGTDLYIGTYDISGNTSQGMDVTLNILMPN